MTSSAEITRANSLNSIFATVIQSEINQLLATFSSVIPDVHLFEVIRSSSRVILPERSLSMFLNVESRRL